MKIYLAHSTSFDFKNEFYKPLENSQLNLKHDFILPHKDFDKPFASKNYFDLEL